MIINSFVIRLTNVSALAFFFTILARLPDCCGIAYKFDIDDMNKLKTNKIRKRFTIITGFLFLINTSRIF